MASICLDRGRASPCDLMTRDTIPAVLAASVLLAAAASAQAAPTLDLAGGCARATARTMHESAGPRGGGLDADGFSLRVPGLPVDPSGLDAGRLHVAARGTDADTRPAVLAQAATAASAALLVAVSGKTATGCDPAALRAATAPLQAGLKHGASYDFVWSDLSIRTGQARIGARHLSLHLEGGRSGGDARLALSLDGAVSNDQAATLMPSSAELRLSLPASALPALAAPGPGMPPVPVHVDSLQARRDGTSLSGQGDARIAGDPSLSEGHGTVEVTGFDGLLDAASGERLRTALFLAQLVAHKHGDALSWNLEWQGGVLTVNKVPLPLR
jgi:hypothetical protein